MGVTLRQVEVFVSVADHLHFGRAAEALHISQPTVSQEVARLERALGVPLFDRSGRSVRLTPAGEAMVEQGRGLLAQADRLVRDVRMYEASRLKTVRVVATPSVVNRLLPAVIKRAERELPDVTIDDVAVDTGAVAAQLAAEHGDLGLGRFLAPLDGYTAQVVAHEPVFAALSRDHPSASGDAVDLAALHDLPLLLWPREQNPRYHDRLRAICAERGLDPFLLVSPPRIVGSRLYLLAEGRAFSLVPHSVTASLPEGVRALPLTTPAELPLEMQWRDGDTRPHMRALRDLIVAEARRLDGGTED
ncbi:LysR family transcriptional regulator [Yinghuangia seranimata]|uniref:LysR family transcriptional regulator n=1 Tax=Yinghuangia seranimata TaxID=408067 RepID=UPI00248B7745|nr:LysR family transcriptional regulator [Yinghuangia seranimata]MDI2124523.1 LysR family transcriptional regulator [Yinghuangia seranimata]